MQLCMDLLTLPSYNLNRDKKPQILSQSGENSSAYTGAAHAQNRANERFDRALDKFQKTYSPNNSSSGYKQGTHQYMINGRLVTCTTTGSITNCY